MSRAPRRVIDAMCARHRTVERWPVAGDYARNMRDAGLDVTVEEIAPGQIRVRGQARGASYEG